MIGAGEPRSDGDTGLPLDRPNTGPDAPGEDMKARVDPLGFAELCLDRSAIEVQREMATRHGLRVGERGFLDACVGAIHSALSSVDVEPTESGHPTGVFDSVVAGVDLLELSKRMGLSPSDAAHWIRTLVPLVLEARERR